LVGASGHCGGFAGSGLAGKVYGSSGHDSHTALFVITSAPVLVLIFC
jgi:hypothetical protein